ncbi:MAG: FliM/FliN family flagellar motor switch protein [Pseudomonadales bacterium]
MTAEERVFATEETNMQAVESRDTSSLSAVPLAGKQLPQLSAETVTASNTLYRSPPASCANLHWHWRLPPALPIRHWLHFSADEENVHFGLQHDVVGLNSVALDWLEYSGTAKTLAWSVTYEPLIELLQSVFGLDFVLQSIGTNSKPESAASDLHVGFEVKRDDGVTVTCGQVYFPKGWITAVLARSGEQTAISISGWERAGARLPYVIDSISLVPIELQALSIGSTVRLDNASLKDDCARVVVEAGETRLVADLTAMDLTVVGITQRPASDATVYMRELRNMSKDQQQLVDVTQQHPAQMDAAAQPDETTGLESTGGDAIENPNTVDTGAVPVALRFEAGAVTLPFAELQSIRPGYVFHLDKRLHDQPIAVYANNMQVAVGELVCVGDLIGVRITSMHFEKAKGQ